MLEAALRKTLQSCKYWPVKVGDIREHIDRAKEIALLEAADLEWQRVLALRRTDWNPDMPGCGVCLESLPDRMQAACRASRVFRDVESPEQLHTWVKKRFIESYLAWEALEQGQYLLPDGEIKNLIAQLSREKAIQVPQGCETGR